MTAKLAKKLRCAVYTRVSTEYGLDQEFNSLDAQHEAAEAYIKSQAHDGWTLVRTRYDDGGYSGGSTVRPALQSLLDDIRARKIDIIVVYKVDRLTRSLADFAKLVELFDAHSVSFVSVTQQFNTTTSMGRLTLNVLLSFAQFEREVTSERIRDKIAASKRKGLWVGGMIPLGYRSENKKLFIHEEEAARVRLIFQRYLELGSLGTLLPDLRARGITTKLRVHADGSKRGGITFTRGPLDHLLRNRFYVGEIAFKGEILPGEQPPIIEREIFEAVQEKLAAQRVSQTEKRSASEALLQGKIFDDRGNRMTPSHAKKSGQKYRYYISRPVVEGQTHSAGSVSRVPAIEVETAIVEALSHHLCDDASRNPRDLIAYADRIELQASGISVTLRTAQSSPAELGLLTSAAHPQDCHTTLDTYTAQPTVLTIPWTKTSGKRRREMLSPLGGASCAPRPIRAETHNRLVEAIANGRRWLSEIESKTHDVSGIAAREGATKRHVHMTISLAFLAPSLTQAAIKGELPNGIGIARLIDAPTLWSRQYDGLGLAEPTQRRD